MYTADTLLDIHMRAHESLQRLIACCEELPPAQLHERLTGFGFPSIMIQLEHIIGSEWYWQLVITTGFHAEPEMPELADPAAMEAFRWQTAAGTRAYLHGASEAELNTRREMVTDPGERRALRPADVIMRMVTHIYHHQGQVLSMCRALGKVNDAFDLDYPLTELAAESE